MKQFSRVLGVVAFVALIGGPLGTAPTLAQEATATDVLKASSVFGVATDGTGAVLAGVTVTLVGPKTQSIVTDAKGAYSFSNVQPGVYTLSARRSGFNPAAETDVVITPGSSATYNVRLEAETLTSIREIGRTSTTSRRSTFNSSPASVATIDHQAFVDQGQLQVQRLLDQTPGIVVDHPGTSANNAAPGAISFPSIRGGLGFETASLIDGHPLAVGNFGDYVTTFLNANVLQSVELIKGPGAAAPEINYAIGGTVNFRTLDPTRRPTSSVTLGYDSFGGQFSNFVTRGTVANGKLGYVLDLALDGTPGPLRDTPQTTTLSQSVLLNGQRQTAPTIAGPANSGTNGIQNNPSYYTTSLVGCCLPVSQTYNNKTELVKLRYNFNPATSLTVSYLGSQTWTDQNGNHIYQYSSNFAPGSGYLNNGSYAAGQNIALGQNIFYPSTEWEVNNEPIFQGEFRTAVGSKDTFLLRGYGASINRLQYNGLENPSQPYSTTQVLNGTAALCPPGATYSTSTKLCSTGAAPVVTAFNNQPVNLTFNGSYFRSAEEDKIRGFTGEYDHVLNADKGDILSLSLDETFSGTYAYDYSGSGNTPSVPAGSKQRFQTILLRGIFNPTPALSITLSNYFDQYYQHYTTDGGVTFRDQTTNRYDGRIGAAFRATRDLSFRLAVGSAIAPPYLNLLDRTTTAPMAAQGNTIATNTVNAGTLLPETSFSYTGGFDLRLADGLTTVSFDLYRTNLQNQFLTSQFANGSSTVCPTNSMFATGSSTLCVPTTGNGPSTAPLTLPLYTSSVLNLGNSRYEGIELAVRRQPATGIGFIAQGALLRAYPYNVSGCFYSTTYVKGVLDCNQRNTNLAVINGVNYQNTATSGIPGSYNSVSNHAIPYAQGYAELSFQNAHGTRLSFGEQYYGSNNSLNVPAFFAANINGRISLGEGTTGSINVDNLFNTYGNAYVGAYGGTGVPLLNGKIGLTNANVLTPRTIRFSITRTVGR